MVLLLGVLCLRRSIGYKHGKVFFIKYYICLFVPLEIEFLTLEDVLALHDELIQRYGGSRGLRDAGVLEAALGMPQAGFGGQYFHEFPHEMGAAYLFHLVRNHPFIDGNKRIALACAILFFKINRVPYSITEEEAVELTLPAANGQLDKSVVTKFFRQHLKIGWNPD